jgi:hypothetical protein
VDHHICTESREVLVVHRNALLSETGRLRLARCVVEDGWSYRRSGGAVPGQRDRWAGRYRQAGPAGMVDRSSRPRCSPARTPVRVERRIVKLRFARRWGPARIAGRLGLPASTVHAVLARYRVPRLAHLDRATGTRIRRYEHPAPGDLVHVDIKKLGRIPDGGGHRNVDRRTGDRNARATTRLRRHNNPVIGWSYLHTALDDHSRLAYTEILTDETLTDETQHTAAAFWTRAQAFFTAAGVPIRRVLTDIQAWWCLEGPRIVRPAV